MHMKEHFLKEFIKELAESNTFVARPRYNRDGDCLVYQTVDEMIVADRIDALLTIYRSAIDDRAIGFQLKDVLALVRKFEAEHGPLTTPTNEEVDGEVIRTEISMTFLLLAAYEHLPVTILRREAYAKTFENLPSSRVVLDLAS